MHTKQGDLPTPMTTLDELLDEGGTQEMPVKVFVGHSLGARTFLLSLKMHEFYNASAVANEPSATGGGIAQRPLDAGHAEKLAVYILKGLVSAAIDYRVIQKLDRDPALEAVQEQMGKQPYMALQPIVANIRECNPGGKEIRAERLMTSAGETAAFKVFLSQKHVLWVIDGQHRRKGFELIFKWLEEVRTTRAYPRKNSLFGSAGTVVPAEHMSVWEQCYAVARQYATVAVEVHLGLNIEQERQLFHDLNNKGKRIDTSLALQFDNANALNIFIKEQLIDRLNIRVVEKDKVDWPDGTLPRKDLVAVNAVLFLNKSNINGAAPQDIENKSAVAVRFWEAVTRIQHFGDPDARAKTVAAQPVLLKALGKLVYDLAFSPRRDKNTCDAHLDTLISALSVIDFGHANPIWRYHEMDQAERNQLGLSSLESYLPPLAAGSKRDLGAFKNGGMQFGNKHNDIYPVLADIIRWRLGLPSRRA